jgi:hypothetical protein
MPGSLLQGRIGYAWWVTERAQVAERAAVAYEALAELAETVEDEWQYVTDLVDAYLPSIRALGTRPAGRAGSISPEAEAAVDESIAEIELIADPHKAIDWLSTFPHVIALALGGDVDAPAAAEEPGEADATDDSPPEPDEYSPFRVLRGGR